MNQGFKLIVAIILSWTSSVAFAAPGDQIADIFADHFHNRYQSGRCGTNVTEFFQDMEKSGVDLADYYMLVIENKGFSGFGMVNVEEARDYIRGQWESTEKNWYHHVVAVNGMGQVYDFDFKTRPRVVKVADYIEAMFLNETECTKKSKTGEFCIGRDVKLNQYTVQIIPASDIIQQPADKSPDSYPSVTLKKMRQSWQKILRREN